ncbi:hypothetical protein EDC01DRAFT_664243 [Geopyxis carbonaria]|nr:hypothetical protein EDC01DRAFT_664243 [Geopyxis carbonaria]
MAETPVETVSTGLGPRYVYSSTPGTFTSIPTISLSPSQSPATIAAAIYSAATEVGFFYITDHGVPASLVAQTHAEMQRFFRELSVEQKMKLNPGSWKKNGKETEEKEAAKGEGEEGKVEEGRKEQEDEEEEYSGYWPIRATIPDGAAETHMYESIIWPYDALADPLTPAAAAAAAHDANARFWPPSAALPGFRVRIAEYEGAMLTLARRLLGLFAVALGEEGGYFDKYFDPPGTLLSLNHYPASVPQSPESAGVHAHSDFEAFTILSQDAVPSLEVLSLSGAWVPAPPIPDTFLINIGDTLRMMTNDVFMSTVHRAYNRTGRARYSIPYFFGANYDAMLDVVPSCVDEAAGRGRRYGKVRAGEYVRAQLARTYVTN